MVGPIWPEGAWDGRSTARWWASAAGDRRRGMPDAIGEGDGCVVFVREWRSSRATLIGPELNRERRVGLIGAEEGHGSAGSIELGEGEREWPRPVWRKRELGRSFYRRPGRGRGERWRAPASLPRRGWWCTVVTTGRLGQGDRGTRRQSGRRASNGETTERWRPAAIASLARSRARGRR